MKDDFLTFSEFAKLAKVNRSTVYRRVAKTVALQQLVQHSATGQVLISRSALRFFTVAECCNDATTCNSSCNNLQQVPQKAKEWAKTHLKKYLNLNEGENLQVDFGMLVKLMVEAYAEGAKNER